MKSIKFRAWNSAQGVLAQVEELRLDQQAIIVKGDKYLWDLKRCTVEQYTGIHDVNGKEIYDGDIDKDGVIQWRKGGFWLVMKGRYKPNYIMLTPDFEGRMEIVGDIHRTPELIGDEQ